MLEGERRSVRVTDLLVNGMLIKIDSMRPPVFKPNVVPRSYTKLNSTYLQISNRCVYVCVCVRGPV